MALLLRGIRDASSGTFCLVRTKKDLKQCINDFLVFDDPSIFGQQKHPLNGEAIVIDPDKRSKFAQVWTTPEGRITKVA